MANWYELTEDQIKGNADALRQRAAAYRETLLATPVGRAVFMDIMNAALISVRNRDDAMYAVALHDFISEIKSKAGINDPLAVLEAEAEVSARYEPQPEAPKENLL